jgi:hypothetical protein
MRLINLTPHDVVIYNLNGDKQVFPSEGNARVDTTDTPLPPLGEIPVVTFPVPGPVTGLPAPVGGVAFIVSLMVLDHPDVRGRADVFAPATGPKHAAIRDDKGRIMGVTRLVAAAQKA